MQRGVGTHVSTQNKMVEPETRRHPGERKDFHTEQENDV